jgi:mannose-6-phosphate isomerase-like protein (cupin superfamily)
MAPLYTECVGDKVFLSNLNEEALIRKAEAQGGACVHLLRTERMIFAICVWVSNEKTGWHAHPDSEELFYVIDGEGVIDINGIEYAMAKGQVVYFPPKAWHASQNTGEEPFTILAAIESARTYMHPRDEGEVKAKPEPDVTVLSLAEGRRVSSRGRTSIQLIEPRSVPRDSIAAGYARYTEIALGRATYTRGTGSELHQHADNEQFLYVLSGKGVYRVDGEEVEVQRGTAIYLPQGGSHRLTCLDGAPLELLFASPRYYQAGEDAELPAEL